MSNTTQVAPFEAARQAPETLQSLLRQDAYRKRFEQVLGERAGQFIGSIMSVGATMPDVEPRSILASAAIAAALDLPIDRNLGFAWIVPYRKGDRKLAQYQMGYRGYIQLALRTAAYARMNAKPINAEALNGYDTVGEPVIDWSKLDETKPEVGYVFAFQLTSGFIKTAYWPKTKVEEHARRYSQAYRGGYESPWKTHFTQMALKTVIANELRHWGILSVQTQTALREDQGMHVDVDSEVVFPAEEDSITRPKFESDGKEEKAEAAAGLAPQASAPDAEQPKRTRQRREAAPATTTAAPQQSPTPASQEPPAKTSAPAAQSEAQPPDKSAEAQAPAPTTQTATASPTVTGGLFETENYKQIRQLMERSQITDAELIYLCQSQKIMTDQQTKLDQLSEDTLGDLITSWPAVAGQIRINRRQSAAKK